MSFEFSHGMFPRNQYPLSSFTYTTLVHHTESRELAFLVQGLGSLECCLGSLECCSVMSNYGFSDGQDLNAWFPRRGFRVEGEYVSDYIRGKATGMTGTRFVRMYTVVHRVLIKNSKKIGYVLSYVECTS